MHLRNQVTKNVSSSRKCGSHVNLRFIKTKIRAQVQGKVATSLEAPGLRPQPWTGSPKEQEALSQLRNRFQSLAAAEVPSDSLLVWYLRDRYFDVDEAEQKLKSMLAWKKQFRPEEITAESVAREAATGKSAVAEHLDKYGRPTIVIVARHHVTGDFPIRDSQRLCVHHLDTALARLPPGGEQIIGVFDLRDFGAANADLMFIRFMVDAFFEYYPRRVAQVLLVEAPWVFKPMWEVIRPLMRKYAALVRFVSIKELKEEYFTPETLPSAFR